MGYEHKYHYFYKIINNINNHYYYGIHSTNNLNDNYMGSGVRIKKAYLKYGKENFTKYILKYFNTRDELEEYESYIVNEDLLNDINCYNIVIGGKRGICTAFSGHHHTEEHKQYLSKKLTKTDTELKQKRRIISKDGIKKSIQIKDLSLYINDGWSLGRHNCSYVHTMKEYRDIQKQKRINKEKEIKDKQFILESENNKIHDVLLNIAKDDSIDLSKFGWNLVIIKLLKEHDIIVKSNIKRFIKRHCPEFFDYKNVYSKKINKMLLQHSGQCS